MKTVTIKKDGRSIKIQSIGYCDLLTSCLIDNKVLDSKIFPYSFNNLDGIDRAKARQQVLQEIGLYSQPIMLINLENVSIIEEKEETPLKIAQDIGVEKNKNGKYTDLTEEQEKEIVIGNPTLKKKFDLITNMTYVVITFSNLSQIQIPFYLFEKEMNRKGVVIDYLNWK